MARIAKAGAINMAAVNSGDCLPAAIILCRYPIRARQQNIPAAKMIINPIQVIGFLGTILLLTLSKPIG